MGCCSVGGGGRQAGSDADADADAGRVASRPASVRDNRRSVAACHRALHLLVELLGSLSLPPGRGSNVLLASACTPRYHAGMTKPARQYTVRNGPASLDRALRAKAAARGVSLNALLVQALAARGSGPNGPGRPTRCRCRCGCGCRFLRRRARRTEHGRDGRAGTRKPGGSLRQTGPRREARGRSDR